MSSTPKSYGQCVESLDAAVLDLHAAIIAMNRNSGVEQHTKICIESTRRDVLNTVHRRLAHLSRDYNRTLPIMQLPPEVLVAIFEWLPTLQDLAHACGVCKDWHSQLMHSAPSAWSSVKWRVKRHPGSLTAVLRRSAAADLYLDLSVTRYNWKEAFLCLTTHLPRTVFFRLDMEQKLRSKAKLELARVLALPAPRLRSFRIFDSEENYRFSESTVLPLFGGRAPSLRFVKMHVDLEALARVVLPSVKSALVANTQHMCAEDVTTILKAFPGVESLAFEIDHWNHAVDEIDHLNHAVDDGSGTPVQLPESVKDLVLISTSAAVDPTWLLRHLDHKSVPHVCVSYNRAAAAMLAELAAAAFAPGGVACMRINTSEAQRIGEHEHELNVDMWPERDRSRPQRTVLDLPLSARPGSALFAGLTWLLVGELVLAVGDPFPPADALRELTVQMLAPEHQMRDGHDSVFLLPRDRRRVLSCPSLRKLTFGSREHSRANRLAPHLALDFVRFHLDAPLLETVALRGLELVTTILDDAVALVTLAPNFDIDDEYIVKPDRKDDLIAWS